MDKKKKTPPKKKKKKLLQRSGDVLRGGAVKGEHGNFKTLNREKGVGGGKRNPTMRGSNIS